MGKTLRTQVALYLDDAQVKRLDLVARVTGKTKQDLLRVAVADMLNVYRWVRPSLLKKRKP